MPEPEPQNIPNPTPPPPPAPSPPPPPAVGVAAAEAVGHLKADPIAHVEDHDHLGLGALLASGFLHGRQSGRPSRSLNPITNPLNPMNPMNPINIYRPYRNAGKGVRGALETCPSSIQ